MNTLMASIATTNASLTAEVTRATTAENGLTTRINTTNASLTSEINRATIAENNLSTRILEKDYYTPKRDCVINETNNYLQPSHNLIR